MKLNSFLVLLLCLQLKLVAQNNTQSAYSARGIGEINSFENAFSKALGGLSNGIRSEHFYSFANPASLAGLKNVSCDFAINGAFGKAYTTQATRTFYNGNFGYFNLGFTTYQKELRKKVKQDSSETTSIIKDYKTIWATAIGFSPYSSIGSAYTKTTDTNFAKYTSNYKNYGGLNRINLANAVNLNKNFSIGANASYLFGQINNHRNFIVDDSLRSRTTSDTRTIFLNGFAFDFGLQGNHYDTIIKWKTDSLGNRIAHKKRTIKYTYGATYSAITKLNYKESRLALNSANYYSGSVDTLINQDNIRNTIYLPSSFSAGFAITYNHNWLVGFDYKVMQWGNLTKTLFNDPYKNSSQYSFGLAYRPDYPEEMRERYTGAKKRAKPTLEYRFGFRKLNSGYQYLDNNNNLYSLSETGFSFGIGIPKIVPTFPKKMLKNVINITAEYVVRGTTNNGLIKENLYKLTLGINLNDNWFVKRKYY